MESITFDELKDKTLGMRGEIKREIYELELILNLLEERPQEIDSYKNKLNEVIYYLEKNNKS